MIPVILLEQDETIIRRIKTSLPGNARAIEVRSLDALRESLQPGEATVLIIGPGIGLERCSVFLRSIESGHPEVGSMVIVDEVKTGILREAMRLGVEDVISFPIDDRVFSGAIQRIYDKSSALACRLGGAAPENPGALRDSEAQTVGVFSTKGGVGKSFIATNLAVCHSLARKDHRVALLDYDLQFGDTAVMLQLFPKHTIAEAAASIERLDAEMMNVFFARHASGIDVLVAPLEPEHAEFISSDELVKIHEVVSEIADFIVVDLPADFTDKVLSILDRCDLIYLVTSLDIPSIKNTMLALRTFDQLHYRLDNIRLILNRADSKVELKAEEAGEILDFKITAQIPSGRVVPISINRGAPLVQEFPRSNVASSIVELHEATLKDLEELKKREGVRCAQQAKQGVGEYSAK